MEESFARVETKYLLTAAQASAVAEGLRQQGFRRADFGSPGYRACITTRRTMR